LLSFTQQAAQPALDWEDSLMMISKIFVNVGNWKFILHYIILPFLLMFVLIALPAWIYDLADSYRRKKNWESENKYREEQMERIVNFIKEAPVMGHEILNAQIESWKEVDKLK